MGEIEKFISDLKKRGASARTRSKHLGALRSFFAWARRRDYVAENPADGLKAGHGERRAARALTLEEAAALIQATRTSTVVNLEDGRRRPWVERFAPPEHLFFAVALAVYTGLRRRSIHRLRWRDVDLSRGAILVPPELMKAGREHEVPIHPALDRVLREALRSRGKVDPEGLVIGCEVGKTVVALHSACRRAGLEPIGWHTLRHSFGSWLDQVASFAELRALLGHAPGNIVSARYAHPQWEQLVAVIGRLPDLIGDRGASASQKA